MSTQSNNLNTKLAVGVFVRAAFVSLGGWLVGNGVVTEDQAQTITGASDVVAGLVVIALTIAQSLWSKWRANKTAKDITASKVVGMVLLAALVGIGSGCVAIRADSTADGAAVWAMGWGADSSAQLANVAVTGPGSSSNTQTGVSFDSANGKQESYQAIQSLIQLGAALAPILAAGRATPNIGVKPQTDTQAEVCEVADTTAPTTDTDSVSGSSALADKIAEAKANGKPLMVLAGNVGCSYCSRMDAAIDKTPGVTASGDIVFYRETSTWANNAAAKWTGGGAFPVLRITQWDTSGNITCDHKVNRPQTLADIEAALLSCGTK